MAISSLPSYLSLGFQSYKPFELVEAPLFIWVAAIILFTITIVILLRLRHRVNREQRLYQKIAHGLQRIKGEYGFDLHNGLPQTVYEAVGRLFQNTPFVLLWYSFVAQLLVRRDAASDDRFWTSASAEAVFNEASVLEPRVNRNFYIAVPGMVTGLGLLCTFIAILFALLDVRLVDNRFTGLDKLVSGLSEKFFTSIFALLAATIFLLGEIRNWLMCSYRAGCGILAL